MKRTLIFILAVLSLPAYSAASTQVEAQAPADATQHAGVLAPAGIADTLMRAVASEDLQRSALAHLADLDHGGRWLALSERLTGLEREFETIAAEAMRSPETINAIELDRDLRGLHREVAGIGEAIAVTVRRLEHDGGQLGADIGRWQERLALLEKQKVPAIVLEHVRSVVERLEHANGRVREFRDRILIALDRALRLQVRLDDSRSRIAAHLDKLNSQRTTLERLPLWELGAASARLEALSTDFSSTWSVQRDYIRQSGGGLLALFLGVLLPSLWLFSRRTAGPVEPVQRAFGRPFAASLLIALVALGWLAPNPPRLLFEILFLLVPLPAAMVARRATAVPIPWTIYGIAFATMLLSLRGLLEAMPLASRALMLAQIILIAAPLAVDLRQGRLARAFPRVGPALVRGAAWLILAMAGLAAYHVVFGFSGPLSSVRSGLGSVLGAILIFGTTAVVLYGAARALLATPVAQCLHSVRNGDPALLGTIRVAISALATASVIFVWLGSMGLVPALATAGETLMGIELEVGAVTIAVKSIVLAGGVILATIFLTGIVGFLLEREIVPRLKIGAGAGYAVVTFTRWTMLIVGAVLALGALGIDMGKITLLAGALSVGVGFGLQNVINNFVSGLILIVERPIGVGDVIEWGSQSGTVTRIGIRSSTVRTGQGAEILVPNGDLVSKEVVNWTRSDRQRRYDIDIGVALGAEPEVVMGLLAEAAREVPVVLKTPSPRVMFKGIGEDTLTFTVLAWVATVDEGSQAQNALRVAMTKKLEQAGIAPFSRASPEAPAAG